MTEEEHAALAALRFNWAPTPDDLWQPSRYHVEDLHRDVVRTVLDGLADARDSSGSSPVGVVVQGQKGAGKTHLLGWVRERAQALDGYFVLVSLLNPATFWTTTVQSVLESLSRTGGGADRQVRVFLRRLASLVGVPRTVRRAVAGETAITPQHLDTFIGALRRHDGDVGRDCQQTARALVLYAAEDFAAQDLGQAYLNSVEETIPGERAAWGMRRDLPPPERIVQDISRLLALTGPTIIAVDQIDTLIAQSLRSTAAHGPLDPGDALALEQVAGGLMSLREVTRRTLTVVACLPASWALIRDNATDTVRDRFREAIQLKGIPSAAVGQALIGKRFAAKFAEIGFQPPYPTWPVDPAAFEDAPDYTPRQLLIRIDAHVQDCLRAGEVTVLRLGPAAPADAGPTAPAGDPATTDDLAALDTRLAALVDDPAVTTEVERALAPKTEDETVPALLAAGLTAWIAEQGDAGRAFSQDPPPGTANPPLHARLRRSLDESTEDEEHWAFRAVGAKHATAALNRIRAAATMAGLDAGVAKRRLFLLRDHAWSSGPATTKTVAAFEAAGGRTLPMPAADLRILAALRRLLADDPPGLRAWLASRRPTGRVSLLAGALAGAVPAPAADPAPATVRAVVPAPASARLTGYETREYAPVAGPSPGALDGVGPPADAPTTVGPGGDADAGTSVDGGVPVDGGAAIPVQRGPEPAAGAGDAGPGVPPAVGDGATDPRRAGGGVPVPGPTRRAAHGAVATVLLGRSTGGETAEAGRPVGVALEALRKHTAIFAGSGSGKTVLIRRLVEECALHGVSSIVLDPNNDLARLGDPWPEPPDGWAAGDAARAADYLAGTDVVVWTPRRSGGRPLSFQPLPDFRSVVDDGDEFGEAVEAAVASIAPRLRLDGRTQKAQLGQAVLRKAVEYFGRRGGSTLPGLVGLLSALPDGVIDLDNAEKIAGELAQNLTAAMVNDPLFGGEGTPVDPGLLLTPPPGKRARVSVISLVGLPGDDRRQGFVNQLQMALFAWIRRNPAGDRPLGGLFVMDEAQTLAPSGPMTACTQSTLALASQARKYGLGLVFATQAPKGLHNRIPGNAATQFFGLLNAPAQIAAAREMAQAKGSDVSDISRLRTGQFYAAVDGTEFARIQAPLCLSHHPRSPLTVEEVLRRARDGTFAPVHEPGAGGTNGE
ncbi:ATP-binding protein [Polymorphospora sp. A560]